MIHSIFCCQLGARKLIFNQLCITLFMNCKNVCFALEIFQFAYSFETSFNGFKIDLWDNFNIQTEISSCPRTLLTFRDFRIFKISISFMLTELNSDVIMEAQFNGNLLLLFIKEHLFAKYH